jgi:hypothetical protein
MISKVNALRKQSIKLAYVSDCRIILRLVDMWVCVQLEPTLLLRVRICGRAQTPLL